MKYKRDKISFFCVTLILHLLWAGPGYLPVKWQISRTLLDNVSFSQNGQISLFL